MRSLPFHKLLDLVGIAPTKGLFNPDIRNISFNSKEVSEGYLFLGLPGLKVDGGIYWKEALNNGAEVAIISEEAYVFTGKIETSKLLVLQKPLQDIFGQIISEFWNKPSNKLKLIGVTGTNGKTTTSFLLEHIFRELGKEVALFGTLFNRWPGYYEVSSHTTDFPDKLQPKLYQAIESNVEVAIMEVSSHAIAQKRISGCEFDGAIFTNLSQDHLDYHKDMQSYFETKMELFQPPFLNKNKGVSIINIDNKWGRKLKNNLDNETVIVSTENKINDYEGNKFFYVTDKKLTQKGSYCFLNTHLEKIELFIPLIGEFNLMNAIQAIALTNQLGFSLKEICNAVRSFEGVPGRMEKIKVLQKDVDGILPEVIVDYAHSPDGLMKVLKSIKGFNNGKLITIFGCGGDRDIKKRALMGSIAESLSDIIFITSDNPRTESPSKIIDDILIGIKNIDKVKVNLNRYSAIKQAISLSKSGDIILIAGKGHEDYQILRDRTIFFDDRKVARELLTKKLK